MDGLDIQAPDDGDTKLPKAKFGNDRVIGAIAAPASQPAPKAAPKGKFGGDPIIAKVSDQPSASGWAPAQSTGGDFVKSLGSGLISGVKGVIGLPGAVAGLADKGAQLLASHLPGAPSPEQMAAAKANPPPTSLFSEGSAASNLNPGQIPEAVNKGIDIATAHGADYKPQTAVGRYAKTAGEFAPGAFGGPAGLAGRLFKNVAIPAVVGETAGHAADEIAPGSGEIVKGITGALAGGAAHVLSPAPNAGVATAAGRLGVDVPRGVATDSMLSQRATQVLRNFPGAGEPLIKAGDKTIQQLGEAAQRAGDSVGGSSKLAAGSAAKDSITNWTTGESADKVKTAYDRVDKLVNPNTTTKLASTQNAVANIAAERAAAHLPDGQGSAIRQVLDAAQAPNGLTHAGIQKLRTSVGEMLDGKLTTDASGAELKRIYGALTEDLGQSAANAGGPAGEAAWKAANATAKSVADKRQALSKIVGIKGDVAPEAVFDRIAQMARDKGNATTLAKARQAMGSDWGEVAGTVVKRMGLDKSGQFSAARFLSDYGSMSPQGKAILFNSGGGGAGLRQSLDDIATVSQRLKDMGKFANPSGTAQNAGGLAEVAGLIKDPIGTLAGIIGGRLMAHALSRPATAASTAKFMTAYGRFANSPGPATLTGTAIAARNLANTFRDNGINISPEELTKKLSGSGNEPFTVQVPYTRSQ